MLQAKYLTHTQTLTDIDSYFMIDCVNGGSVPSPESVGRQANGTRTERATFD